MQQTLEQAIAGLADAAVALVSLAHAQAHPNSPLARAKEQLGADGYQRALEDAVPAATRRGLERLIRAVPEGPICELDLACFYASVVRDVSDAIVAAAIVAAAEEVAS